MQERPEIYRWHLHEHLGREIGRVRPLPFARKVGGCEDLIRRFHLYADLDGHTGCVNTVHFNPSGDILVSGSDDRDIVFWNWAAKSKILSFPSGHEENVFQARIMPFSDDRVLISCAADGQVRQVDIHEDGCVKTKKLAQHRGRVHKLAIEPGSSRIFLSCGEDGVVRRFDLRDGSNKTAFKCTALIGSSKIRSHPVRLNAVVINGRNPSYFAVGGSDRYARVYDVRMVCWGEQNRESTPVDTYAPAHLRGKGPVHVTALAYSHQEELLVSYNDEHIYLFENNGKANRSTENKESPVPNEPQAFKGHRNARTVKGVSFFGPNSEYVVSGSDCGNIFIWKKKTADLIALFKGDTQVVNCLEPHPHATILATSGIEKTAKIWAPIAEDYVALPRNAEKIMKLNQRGREEGSPYLSDIMHVLRLQRRHVQTELARWYSRGESEMGEEADEGSDNDESTINDYLKLVYMGVDEGSDDDENTQMAGRDCNIS
ncbi:hypothetical protein GOP47_0011492 [Adiantum capillus-veneris]|uniref:Uncharacterized protein n=1 Tax=Adiantum capillus-veneris TaxID=13818 RepID=A0A9D4ZFG3_ADICA|nr:hypothetical protein GOP47_0011492 [Adiantum capillus-veneris]